jgi:hypothetical protein
VLGWREWRSLDAEYGLELLRKALAAAIEAGIIRRQPLVPLAQLLLGAFTEAAMLIGHAAEPATTRRQSNRRSMRCSKGCAANRS